MGRAAAGRGDPVRAQHLPSNETMDGLSIFALVLLIVVFLVIAYGMIIIHDIPYHIAQKRNHPHQDAGGSGNSGPPIAG